MTHSAAKLRRARLSEPQRELLVALCTERRGDRACPRRLPNGARRTLAALRQKGLVRPVPGAASETDVEPTEAAFTLLDLQPIGPQKIDDEEEGASHGARGKRAERKSGTTQGEGRTKAGTLLALLHRPEGATLAEMQAAVGWQAHSVRGFLSGTVRKSLGSRLTATVGEDGVRRYRVKADQADAS